MTTARALRLTALAVSLPAMAMAYPLDGRQTSGIRRLEAYRAAQEVKRSKLRLPPGARLGIDDIELSLVGKNETWDLVNEKPDPALQAALGAIFDRRDRSYSVAVIDITDPAKIAWAGLRSERSQYPGSVGKLVCMAAFFDGLRRAFPETAERARILRETVIVADGWVYSDSHKVPHADEAGTLRFGTIQQGDRFTLSEWMDHMISSSANAAGAIIWKEAMLLRQFGSSYPVAREAEIAFFKDTPKAKLTELSQTVIDDALAATGIDLEAMQQGTMWTRAGQARIPGIASWATPRELARLLLKLEQGKLVDAWSSLEMKRYLYMTKRRYRYVYAPELSDAAVYFKSGSLYACSKKPEADFACGKYKGNVENFMNSVAIIETPAQRGEGQKRYIVAMMSNVLRVNSAWDHSRVGAAIDKAVRTRKGAAVDDRGSAGDITDSGRSE